MIVQLYNQFFNELILEKLTSERTGETDEEIKGHLPKNIIEAGIDNKDIDKLTRNYRAPERSLTGMILRLQKDSIEKNPEILGLEEVDPDLTELKDFQDRIDTLKKRFDFEVEKGLYLIKEAELKTKAAETTMRKLENANGWILMEGNFNIQKEGDSYRCTYQHPVNAYINNPVPVTFFVFIPINGLEENVKEDYAHSVGISIPLKIYGQVWRPIDRRHNIWDLQINALAVYK